MVNPQLNWTNRPQSTHQVARRNINNPGEALTHRMPWSTSELCCFWAHCQSPTVDMNISDEPSDWIWETSARVSWHTNERLESPTTRETLPRVVAGYAHVHTPYPIVINNDTTTTSSSSSMLLHSHQYNLAYSLPLSLCTNVLSASGIFGL